MQRAQPPLCTYDVLDQVLVRGLLVLGDAHQLVFTNHQIHHTACIYHRHGDIRLGQSHLGHKDPAAIEQGDRVSISRGLLDAISCWFPWMLRGLRDGSVLAWTIWNGTRWQKRLKHFSLGGQRKT